ncbi:hypothetical protein RUM43_002557 [Polyplax serrata]|uniref:Potassium channel tetramerisation-type BTB domain-containing protein n=1 Tax=Polyplax serrata TaxID=468196 RepID=A0AAN8NZC1_POLSC
MSRYPESRLAKLFNGNIPIVLDSLKQHYFIDRDGEMFRHILNFMRNSRLLIPENFDDLDLLMEEARYFDITPFGNDSRRPRKSQPEGNGTDYPEKVLPMLGTDLSELYIFNGLLCFTVAAMCRQLEQLKKERLKKEKDTKETALTCQPFSAQSNHCVGNSKALKLSNNDSPRSADGTRTVSHQQHGSDSFECVALHISPDLGERIMLSGDRALLDEVFPEANSAMIDSRSSVAWNQHDTRHVIRFPLNGYCKLNSVQAITRLLNAGFKVAASNGGGVEGQQFSEYLFVRKVYPM